MKKYVKTIILLILVSFSFFVNVKNVQSQYFRDVPDYLNQGKTTEHFKIYYTINSLSYPNDAVTEEQVMILADNLELSYGMLVGSGFREPNFIIPVYVFKLSVNVHFPPNAYYKLYLLETFLAFDSHFLGNQWFNNLPSVHAVEPHYDISVEQVVVPLHELFHLFQHDYPNNWGMTDWIFEGQARMIQDKLFTIADESIGDEFASYIGTVKAYLDNPGEFFSLSYKAALFWTYVTEHYGSDNTEPNRGLDAIVEFWNAVESVGHTNNEILIFNLMLINLGYAHINFYDVYKDFIISNYAKDLTGIVPSKYLYTDETQPPGNYGRVKLEVDLGIGAGAEYISPLNMLASWRPIYRRYNLAHTGPELLQVTVKQYTSNDLFYSLLLTKNNDLLEEIRYQGRSFECSRYTDADEAILIISSLDNFQSLYAQFKTTIKYGHSTVTMNVISPTDNFVNNQAFVGLYTNPSKFSVVVNVKDSDLPIKGLNKDSFEITVGSELATITSCLYSIYNGYYFLEVQAPEQSAPWQYDLDVSVIGQNDLNPNAVVYDDYSTETMIVIDTSSGMSENDKMEIAKSAARLFVDSCKDTNRLGLVKFDSSAALLKALEEKSTGYSALMSLIDSLSASGLTSIGDGLHKAQNELYSNGLPEEHDRIILLTDGIETSSPLINDVIANIINNGTILDVIFIGPDTNRYPLQIWSDLTGGSIYFNPEPSSGTLFSDLADNYRSIFEKNNKLQRVYSNKSQLTGDWNINEYFIIDDASEVSICFDYRKASTDNFTAFLHLPGGGTLAPTIETQSQSISSGDYLGHYIWKLTSAQAGIYMINVSGSDEVEYFVDAAIKSSLVMNILIDKDPATIFVGDGIPIFASISDSILEDVNVVAEVTTGSYYNNLNIWIIHLCDDGKHADNDANDFIFGNNFTSTYFYGMSNYTGISYNIRIKLEGYSSLFGNFTREIMQSVHIDSDENADYDNDFLPNIWEINYGLDPYDDTGINGATGDPDLDGMDNILELLFTATNPILSDTDGGGENDFSEYLNNRDPLCSFDDTIRPPIITATPGNLNVTIHFSNDTNFHQLDLYRSTNPDSNFQLIKSNIYADDTLYIDTGVTNGITYYYKMMAKDLASGKSGLSKTISAIPKVKVVAPIGSVQINYGNKYSSLLEVSLFISASDDAISMRVSTDSSFTGVSWQPYTSELTWTFEEEGLQFIYVQFKDEYDNIGGFYNDTIAYDGIVIDFTKTTLTGFTKPIIILGFTIIFIISYIRKKKLKLN